MSRITQLTVPQNQGISFPPRSIEAFHQSAIASYQGKEIIAENDLVFPANEYIEGRGVTITVPQGRSFEVRPHPHSPTKGIIVILGIKTPTQIVIEWYELIDALIPSVDTPSKDTSWFSLGGLVTKILDR